MKLLNKYLVFIVYSLLAISVLPLMYSLEYPSVMSYSTALRIYLSITVVVIILYLIEKREAIEAFFTTNKIDVLSKCITCILYTPSSIKPEF